jgi:hypothetical protein
VTGDATDAEATLRVELGDDLVNLGILHCTADGIRRRQAMIQGTTVWQQTFLERGAQHRAPLPTIPGAAFRLSATVTRG